MSNRLVRPREVARQLEVSRSTVYRWFWEGRLQGLKLTGGTVIIFQSSLEEFLLHAAELTGEPAMERGGRQ